MKTDKKRAKWQNFFLPEATPLRDNVLCDW
jgi:hypothetical protein